MHLCLLFIYSHKKKLIDEVLHGTYGNFEKKFFHVANVAA